MASRSARIEVLGTLAIIGGLAGFLGGRGLVRRLGPHPTPALCAAMLERYAEHQARAADLSDRPSKVAIVRDEDGGAAAPSPAEVARCAKDLTAEEVDCAMRANNADEVERCLP